MNSISIIPLKTFVRDVKKLKKRYKNILDDIEEFKNLLIETPTLGTSLGHGIYKIRVKNSNKNQGKSGGYRIITCFIDEDYTVYLVKMYDKGEIDSIKTSKLMEIIEEELKL
jgi:mRNA-degrading endonuclease RelE of RelBE toxin-antitoxin system